MLNVLNILLINKHSMLFTSCVKNSEQLIQYERVKIKSHKNWNFRLKSAFHRGDLNSFVMLNI